MRSVRESKFSPQSSHMHTYPTSGVLLLDSIFISALPDALLDLSGVRVVAMDYVVIKELIQYYGDKRVNSVLLVHSVCEDKRVNRLIQYYTILAYNSGRGPDWCRSRTDGIDWGLL